MDENVLYQVVAKCSDGDVVISKNNMSFFHYRDAKLIQKEHSNMGAEVVLRKIIGFQDVYTPVDNFKDYLSKAREQLDDAENNLRCAVEEFKDLSEEEKAMLRNDEDVQQDVTLIIESYNNLVDNYDDFITEFEE